MVALKARYSYPFGAGPRLPLDAWTTRAPMVQVTVVHTVFPLEMESTLKVADCPGLSTGMV
jgi:hypothetical protein